MNGVPSVFCLIDGRSSLSTSKYIEIAVDLIVIPRSFSSCRVSVNRTSPAFADAIMPALETKESVNVDFPWSTGLVRHEAHSVRLVDDMIKYELTMGND